MCLSVCPHDNSKTNDPKVFKFGVAIDLGISYKCYDFGVKGQGHKAQNGDGVAGVSYALCRVPSLWFIVREYVFYVSFSKFKKRVF